MTTLSPSAPLPNLLAGCAHFVRRSRSIASMLPSLLLSGLMTLVITAVMHLMWRGPVDGFVGMWMESWLTVWPIAFPLTYIAAPTLLKFSTSVSAPSPVATRAPGLGTGDVAAVSDRVTANHGLSVLRLKPKEDFRA